MWPTGCVVMWGGMQNAVPSGWLLCDGSSVLRSQYPDLFNVVGDSYGGLTQPNEFYLPDMRGRFVRGVDGGSGRDPDAASRTDMQNPNVVIGSTVGSVQSHAFQRHTHPYQMFPGQSGNIASGNYWEGERAETDPPDPNLFQTSSETRPINAAFFFIIKT